VEVLPSNVIHCLSVSVKLGRNRYCPLFGKRRSQWVVLSLLCVPYQPLLRKAEFAKIVEKYHMALDQ